MTSEEFYDLYHKEGKYKNSSFNHRRRSIFGNSKNLNNNGNYPFSKLSRINDPKYKRIESLPDNDYRNSIAYEMLIRTDEYFLAKSPRLSKEERILILDKLGISYEEDVRYNNKKKERKKFIINYDLTIDNIDNGLDKLINFYIKEKEIYKRKSDENIAYYKYTDKGYIKEYKVTLKKIISSLENYYIPSSRYSKTNKDFIPLNKVIYLNMLQGKFLTFIRDYLPNKIAGKIHFESIRPKLRFKELVNVDINVDLSLSKREIFNMISSLKTSYDEGLIITPMSILYNEEYEIQDIKKIFPFRFSKKNIARAFFIYDLYKEMDSSFKVKRKKLKEDFDNQINSLKNQTLEEIKKIENKYKEYIENLSPSVINKEKSIKEFTLELKNKKKELKRKKADLISEKKEEYNINCLEHNTMNKLCELFEFPDDSTKAISENTIKKYLSFMQEYIDGKKYKELIIGKKISK